MSSAIVDGRKTISTPTLGDFIWVDPGKYTLDGRSVELTYGYFLGKYAVTQLQWEAVMGHNPSHFQGPERPTPAALMAGCNDLPVESVSWFDVQEFLRKASERDGLIYRLPTEAEWEMAAMAGENYTYSGSDDPGEVAWSSENSNNTTHPVGQLKPNAWGFYDMSGNVWEWTHSDWTAKGPEGVDPGWVEANGDNITQDEYERIKAAFDAADGARSVIVMLPSRSEYPSLVSLLPGKQVTDFDPSRRVDAKAAAKGRKSKEGDTKRRRS